MLPQVGSDVQHAGQRHLTKASIDPLVVVDLDRKLQRAEAVTRLAVPVAIRAHFIAVAVAVKQYLPPFVVRVVFIDELNLAV